MPAAGQASDVNQLGLTGAAGARSSPLSLAVPFFAGMLAVRGGNKQMGGTGAYVAWIDQLTGATATRAVNEQLAGADSAKFSLMGSASDG